MSGHQELELAPAYALGSLDEAELATFEKHLAACPECQAAVAAHAPVAGALGHAARPEALPAGSADRLRALYRAEKAAGLVPGQGPPGSTPPGKGGGPGPQAPPRSSGFLIPAALALVSLGMAAAAFQSNRALSALADRTRALEDENARLQDNVTLSERTRRARELEVGQLRAELERCHAHGEELTRLFSDSRQLFALKHAGTFGADAAGAYDRTSGDVAISVASLPAPPAGKTYKLWAFVKGKPAPQGMGSFDPANGKFHLEKAPADAEKFAISLETDPNVTSPTEVVLLPG